MVLTIVTVMLLIAVTDLLGIDVPVVGAPMAGVAGGRLVAAVSAGDGLGMIGVGGSTEPGAICEEAQIARSGQLEADIRAWIQDQGLEHSPETVHLDQVGRSDSRINRQIIATNYGRRTLGRLAGTR